MPSRRKSRRENKNSAEEWPSHRDSWFRMVIDPQTVGDWDRRVDRLEQGTVDAGSLEQRIADGDSAALTAFFETLPPVDIPLVISRLSIEDRNRLFETVGAEVAADWIESFGFAQMVGVLEDMGHGLAAEIVERFPSDLRADVLSEFSKDRREAVIDRMGAETAADARLLLRYPEECAGGLMIREYLAFTTGCSVQDVLDDLRDHREKYAEYDVQYAYVIDAGGRLAGVLRMRDLLLARRDVQLEHLMIHHPLSVPSSMSLADLNSFFREHPFLGLPVTEGDGRLVGIIQRSHVEEANRERETGNFLKVSGLLGEDELRSMPLRLRAGRRLMWLSLNIVLNLIAISVIAMNEAVLEKVIALAVFLPMISDMSGCSGNQAVGVSIRELSLNLIRPTEFLRVLIKESAVGVINGLVLGVFVGAIAGGYAMMTGDIESNLAFGLVIGGSLFLNTLLSVCLGGSIPLMLRWLKMDPALASAPILTTVTDMCGFFLVLTLASLSMSYLV